ncbi:MAG: aspartate-semialdehyde dehydrogenase [endosymbiont of Escarpia spicata]|uniref:Aspartate-semialdehyde dehydrogenase n=1 Tax=endosymbiont of Escarpia spicata TaxID=2200908 RepID=A0A370DV22_9GAMM|nr:MAG: aspartate-semialdehyde dehydrogenase [endosymbiont of Escarpia spicata]
MNPEVDIALVGATGLVGETLLEAISSHPTLAGSLQVLGDEEAVGDTVEFGDRALTIADLSLFDFTQVRIVISTGEDSSAGDWLDLAQDAGCIILDIGSRLLEATDLPPVVGWVNPESMEVVSKGGIITLPDAGTSQLVRVLKPVLDRVGLEQVSLVSCQAVSDFGRAGVEEMARQTAQLLNAKPITPVLFPRQIAFNLLSPLGELNEDGSTFSEIKAEQDALRILECEDLSLTVTTAIAPVFYGHSQMVQFQTSRPLTLKNLQSLLAETEGVTLVDSENGACVSPVSHASGKEDITVGRIRSVGKNATQFSLFTVADNLRSGIAANVVKIVEVLVKDYL